MDDRIIEGSEQLLTRIPAYEELNLSNPDLFKRSEAVSQRFSKLHARFLDDVQELVDEMGGPDVMKVIIGPGGLADISLHFDCR